MTHLLKKSTFPSGLFIIVPQAFLDTTDFILNQRVVLSGVDRRTSTVDAGRVRSGRDRVGGQTTVGAGIRSDQRVSRAHTKHWNQSYLQERSRKHPFDFAAGQNDISYLFI